MRRIIYYLFSEKFQLLAGRIRLQRFVSVEYLYVGKLFVCYAKYAYVAVFRQKRFYTLYVYFGIFHAGAMADVY